LYISVRFSQQKTSDASAHTLAQQVLVGISMKRHIEDPRSMHKIDLGRDFAHIVPRKVLLLEDDEAFKTTLQAFLESHFFDVVSVPSGVEGVREVMASDFDIIICDMMMPNLPGDMFYFAVERMRPHLCPRFIFITGLKGDRKITDFIRKINGTMLSKPFHIDDLMEMIAYIGKKYAAK
jgi:CheY-like chemotaxis protein